MYTGQCFQFFSESSVFKDDDSGIKMSKKKQIKSTVWLIIAGAKTIYVLKECF